MNQKCFILVLLFISFLNADAQEIVKVKPAFEILREFDKIRDFTMDASGSEAYFTIQSQTEEKSVISKMVKVNDEWKTLSVASFSGAYKDLEPFLSPDGLRLYFVSNRPLHDSITSTKDFDIWFVERSAPNNTWSKPKNLGAPVNSENNEFYPTVSKNGNLYFTCDCPGALGRDDIFFSEWKNNAYSTPIALDENINSKGFEYNAYISKDDTFMIFGGYNREDGLGSGDLYISTKNSSGQWSKAKPLPSNINSKYMDYCPFVDEKQNMLYFTSRRSASSNMKINTISELKEMLEAYENGNSRLYKARFSLLEK
ncbi:PD40 domain-containing protein [Flagellimonas sp. HMM57]|uniref:PD40 domain-containing protein n=1 Tax=unclassified Flagellimonas TaxID=2644544 RepID=UPI0013D654D7|nr:MULTISPECIES: PD40 domain-containing protein [unclassified Flagellimonas]UII75971.1 PD40 domain-containing protein [Flagellimonas sp. HMM57]